MKGTGRFQVRVREDVTVSDLKGAVDAITGVGQVMNLDEVERKLAKFEMPLVLKCEMDFEDVWDGAQQYESLRVELDSISIYSFEMDPRPEGV